MQFLMTRKKELFYRWIENIAILISKEHDFLYCLLASINLSYSLFHDILPTDLELAENSSIQNQKRRYTRGRQSSATEM